jgi:hypothetical protein
MRHPTDAAIRVWHENQSFRAVALNISTGGARLGGLAPLPLNAKVTIQYIHLTLRAQVVWRERNLTGVRFMTRLTSKQAYALQGALVHVLDWRDWAFRD